MRTEPATNAVLQLDRPVSSGPFCNAISKRVHPRNPLPALPTPIHERALSRHSVRAVGVSITRSALFEELPRHIVQCRDDRTRGSAAPTPNLANTDGDTLYLGVEWLETSFGPLKHFTR